MPKPPVFNIPVLILFFLLGFGSPGLSQDLQKKITIEMTNAAISDILREISILSGIDFSYNPGIIPVDKRITIKVRNKPVAEILEQVLASQGIEYQQVENHLVLKLSSASDMQDKAVVLKKPKFFTLSGFLRDKTTGEVLIGANVYVKGTSLGTTTNGYGFYSLTLAAAAYPVIFSYMGYKEMVTDVNMNEDTRLSVELEEDKLDIREVEILASEGEANIRNAQLSEFRFSQKTLARLPGFGGNLDIIRAMQSVPGIQCYEDG